MFVTWTANILAALFTFTFCFGLIVALTSFSDPISQFCTKVANTFLTKYFRTLWQRGAFVGIGMFTYGICYGINHFIRHQNF